MDKREEKIYLYGAIVEMAIKDMLTNEDSEFYVNLSDVEKKEGDITSFVTGFCLAHLKWLFKFCNQKGDWLDGIHLEQRITVQYMKEYCKLTEDTK